MSAQLCSPGARTEQPTFDSSEGLPPDIPPGTARCGDSTNDLLSRRKRLARDVPSSADEGVEQTKESEGVKDQHPEAGTTREASLALECTPLPFKRCGVEIAAVHSMRVVFRAGMGSPARLSCGALRLDFSCVFLICLGGTCACRVNCLCASARYCNCLYLPTLLHTATTPLKPSSGVGLAFFFRNMDTFSTTRR